MQESTGQAPAESPGLGEKRQQEAVLCGQPFTEQFSSAASSLWVNWCRSFPGPSCGPGPVSAHPGEDRERRPRLVLAPFSGGDDSPKVREHPGWG